MPLLGMAASPYLVWMSWQMGPTAMAIVLGSTWGCSFGCASEPAEPVGAGSASEVHQELRANEVSGAPVVATLHTKDSELTITGTGDGVRYSLLDADGKRRDGLTLEQLDAYDHNLFQVVQFAMAKGPPQSRSGAYTPVPDARIPRPTSVASPLPP
jgi:hypothetical protein